MMIEEFENIALTDEAYTYHFQTRKLRVEEILTPDFHMKKGFNLLHVAASLSFNQCFVAILEKTGGVGLRTQDSLGRTPLHHLASNNNVEVINDLLASYREVIDLEQMNKQGRTALHSAAKHLQYEAAQILIQGGANVDALDVKGDTPLSLVYHRHYPGIGLEFSSLSQRMLALMSNCSQYWPKKIACEISTHEDVVRLVWRLGMQYAFDRHWIPGLALSDHFIIHSVFHTTLTQFVIISAGKERALLCLDKASYLQKKVLLQRHVSTVYRQQLMTMVAEPIKQIGIDQIWGIELAGIDAQWLSQELAHTQLILINSPGLPSVDPISTAKCLDCFVSFYSLYDDWHQYGHYPYQRYKQQLFYTSANDAVKPVTGLLADLNRHYLTHQVPKVLQKIDYQPGQSYSPLLVDTVSPSCVLKNEIDRLFNTSTQAVTAIHNSAHPPALLDFAHYEYVAHGLAYLHLPDGVANVKWWGETECKPIYRLIHHQGLYAYLLINLKQWIISFQGTDPMDAESVKRDLDRKSAGIKRIRQQCLDIVDKLVERMVMTAAEDIKITVCGHSLGGADAQNFFAALLAFIACAKNKITTSSILLTFYARHYRHNPAHVLLNKIRQIDLYAYNPAGIRKTAANLTAAAIDVLNGSGIAISINQKRVRNDIVDNVGETLLHEVPAETATVRSLFFHGHQAFLKSISTAHTDRQFCCEDIGDYEFYEGEEASHHIRAGLLKIEPETKAFDQVKQLLQQGVFSKHADIESRLEGLKTVVTK